MAQAARGGRFGPKKGNPARNAIVIDEAFAMDVRAQLQAFSANPSISHLEFSSSLDNTQRRYIHSLAKKFGLFSKSTGKGDDRFIHVSHAKRKADMSVVSLRTKPTLLKVAPSTLDEMTQLVAKLPSPEDEEDMAMPPPFKQPKANWKKLRPTTGKPVHKYSRGQTALPAYQHRDELLELIRAHQVIVVAGDTGCGKSTQIPQYLLDDGNSKSRIVVTQPRRISAISLAERICEERSLVVGEEVGYCIRLDGKYSRNKTELVFVTTGTLLRWLESDPLAKNFTHIIVDEVHERDKHTDFLLIVLKLLLPLRPNLRVILMSATIQVEKFSSYFDNCPIVQIQGRLHPVQACFLEDVFLLLDDTKGSNSARPVKRQATMMNATCAMCGKNEFADESDFGAHVAMCDGTGWHVPAAQNDDALLSMDDMTLDNTEEAFEGSVCDQVSKILETKKSMVPPSEIAQWITSYQQTQDALEADGGVDTYLVVKLLSHLMSVSYGDGAILVFLPGWEDIRALNAMLEMQPEFSKCFVAILHSSLSPQEQMRAFARVPKGKRKVVLATNIAETSITIEDVAYVIDTGKSKQSKLINGYGALHTEWVSQANCKQRRGRAGRVAPGVCFHLMTRSRYDALAPFLTPELLATSLEESVLAIQMLQWQSGDTFGFESINEFLELAIDPPLPHVIEGAITTLQNMGALNPDQSLTYLGWELAQINLPPQAAKMTLLATLYGVPAPILYASCVLNYRDPFESILGNNYTLRNRRKMLKAEIAGSNDCDHWVLYRAVQGFLSLREGQRYNYCRQNSLVHPVLTYIAGAIRQVEQDFQSLNYVAHFVPNPDFQVSKAIFAAGFYPNILHRQNSMNYATKEKFSVKVADSSLLPPKRTKGSPFEWVAFHDMTLTESTRIVRSATKIHPLTLALFIGNSAVLEGNPKLDEYEEGDDFYDDGEEHVHLVIDEWIVLAMTPTLAHLVMELRRRMRRAFLSFVKHKSHAAMPPADLSLVERVAHWIRRESSN